MPPSIVQEHLVTPALLTDMNNLKAMSHGNGKHNRKRRVMESTSKSNDENNKSIYQWRRNGNGSVMESTSRRGARKASSVFTGCYHLSLASLAVAQRARAARPRKETRDHCAVAAIFVNILLSLYS